MPTVAARVTAIPPGTGEAPWPGHEYVHGWGVFGLPFDSGHVLALRVFPQNSFAPYRTVWHRDPYGRWSIFVDGPRLDIACPRYYGPACEHVGHARVELSWTGPSTLRVNVDEPSLSWTLSVRASAVLGFVNLSARRCRSQRGAQRCCGAGANVWPRRWAWAGWHCPESCRAGTPEY